MVALVEIRPGKCPRKADIGASPLYIPPDTRKGFEMTGTTRSSAGLDSRRRKLLFRSWHRGTREMDLVFGRFADDHIDALDAHDLDCLEGLLEQADTRLHKWITGEEAVPAELDTPLFARIRSFRPMTRD